MKGWADGPMIEINNWTVEGIRAAMDEGERGVDAERWGAGTLFRLQAIGCAVALYDAMWEHPSDKKDMLLRTAAEDATLRLKEIGVNTSMLLNRQVCIDMYRAMKKVVAEDRAAAQED